jgi:uncharacterized cupredoxin-like copper-binding protein
MARRSMWRCCAAAVLILVTAGLAACGEDDTEPAQTGDVPDTSEVEAPPEPAALDVTGADFSFDLGGTTQVDAGVYEVTLENRGKEEHQATLVRLNDGVELSELAAAGQADPTGVEPLALFRGFGGPNGVAPGASATTTVALEPGNYQVLCLIPSPSDDVPHYQKGMLAPLTVAEADGAATELPEADGELTGIDFGFEVPDDFDGSGTFLFNNEGDQAHELTAYSVDDGTTVDDVLGFLGGDARAGPPPITPAGGVALLDQGASSNVEFDLDAGTYAFICFLPDVEAQGQPHFSKGMIEIVEIE